MPKLTPAAPEKEFCVKKRPVFQPIPQKKPSVEQEINRLKVVVYDCSAQIEQLQQLARNANNAIGELVRTAGAGTGVSAPDPPAVDPSGT